MNCRRLIIHPFFLGYHEQLDPQTEWDVNIERYSRLMFYIARQILDDEQLSEDAVQEALLRIARNMHKVGEVSCPQTRNFSVIITRNAALTMKKQSCQAAEEELDVLDRARGNIDELFEQVSKKQLTECILKLPYIYRDALYLYHLYGYSLGETASLLGTSLENVKKRVQRARSMLRNMLIEEGYEL